MERSPPGGSGSAPTSLDPSKRSGSSSASMGDLTGKAARDAKEARDAAKDAAQKLKREATGVAEDMKEEAQRLAGDAKAAMSDLATDVTGKAREVAESQKDMGARSLASVAKAIKGAAREMGEESPQIARYASAAGDKVAEVSKIIKERSISRLIDDVSNYARQQPVAFLAGSVVAGALLARFLKSTSGSSNLSPGQSRVSADRTSEDLVRQEDLGLSAGGQQDELFEAAGSVPSPQERTSGSAGGFEGLSQRAGKPDRPPHGGAV
jgi:hypothetical protein